MFEQRKQRMDKFVTGLQVDDETTASKRQENTTRRMLPSASPVQWKPQWPQCAVCRKILTSDSTKPSKLRYHVETRSLFLRLPTCAKRSRFTETVTMLQHGAAARYLFQVMFKINCIIVWKPLVYNEQHLDFWRISSGVFSCITTFQKKP